jgi:hypothetical protein
MNQDDDPLAGLEAELAAALDITTPDIDFDLMEQDIQRFASEPSVRAVLESGVDLENYSNEIAKDLEIA